MFWQEHNPCGDAWSTQYKAILFYDGEAQRRVAEQSAADVLAHREEPLTTELVPIATFWPAEDYHQKYALRGQPKLASQVRALAAAGTGDDEAAFRDNPLAAKLNAFCYGDLSRQDLNTALRELGYELVGAGELQRLAASRAAH